MSRRTLAAAALSLAAVAPAHAAEAPRQIVVVGEGEATGTPDIVVVTLGVETTGATAGEALRANGAAMRATLQTLKSQGVDDRDVQTSRLSISPIYDYEAKRSPAPITGFSAGNSVTVRFRDIGKAETLIDKVVSAGANRLDGIAFDFSKIDEMRDAARKAAVADARARAELYAAAAGVKLGSVLHISEAGGASPYPVEAIAVSAARTKSAPIMAGEETVMSAITIVYAIE